MTTDVVAKFQCRVSDDAIFRNDAILCVSGDVLALGNWDPQRVVPMIKMSEEDGER